MNYGLPGKIKASHIFIETGMTSPQCCQLLEAISPDSQKLSSSSYLATVTRQGGTLNQSVITM